MNKLRTVCVLLAAALVLPVAAAGKPCELKQVSAVEVAFDADGAILVPVHMEGHPGFLKLQLSAGLPWLYPASVEELGLAARTRGVDFEGSIGSHKIERQVTVKSTVFGGANFTGWDYSVLPDKQAVRPQYRGYPVFGTLSSRFMNVVDMELNLAERRINLFHPNRCNTAPVYWGGEVTAVRLYTDPTGLLLFPMELEGAFLETSLNTTRSTSVVTAEIVKRYLGFDEDSPGVEHEAAPDSSERASFRAMSLTAKGLQVHNTRVRIRKFEGCVPSASGKDSGAIGCRDLIGVTPFSIGTDLMRRLRIYASVADRKIYFTRVDSAAAPAVPVPTAGPGAASAGQGAAQ
jgi:hypothetical protein